MQRLWGSEAASIRQSFQALAASLVFCQRQSAPSISWLFYIALFPWQDYTCLPHLPGLHPLQGRGPQRLERPEFALVAWYALALALLDSHLPFEDLRHRSNFNQGEKMAMFLLASPTLSCAISALQRSAAVAFLAVRPVYSFKAEVWIFSSCSACFPPNLKTALRASLFSHPVTFWASWLDTKQFASRVVSRRASMRGGAEFCLIVEPLRATVVLTCRKNLLFNRRAKLA